MAANFVVGLYRIGSFVPFAFVKTFSKFSWFWSWKCFQRKSCGIIVWKAPFAFEVVSSFELGGWHLLGASSFGGTL